MRHLIAALALAAGSSSMVAVSAPPAHAAEYVDAHLSRNYPTVKHGVAVTFTGWVTRKGSTTPGCGGSVTLQRQIVGYDAWANLSTRTLSCEDRTPAWRLVPNHSADYRLYFSGVRSTDVRPDYSPEVRVNVKRNLHDAWNSSTRVFYGKVTPNYAGRTLYVQRTTCRTPSTACTWTTYRTLRTTSTGSWSSRLPTYATRTHFRGLVTKSNGYLGNYSNRYVTTGG